MSDATQRIGTQPPRDTDLKFMAQEIRTLQQQVKRLQNNRGPTMPAYDSTNFPAQNVHGQYALANSTGVGTPKTQWVYDQTEGWIELARKSEIGTGTITGITSDDDSITVDDSGAPVIDLSVFTTTATWGSSNITIAGGGTHHDFTDTDWTFATGSGESGLFTPSTMEVHVGVYVLSCNAGVFSGSPGTQPFMTLSFQTDGSGGSLLIGGGSIIPTLGTGPAASVTSTFSGYINGPIRVRVINWDTVSKVFSATLSITRIGGFRTA